MNYFDDLDQAAMDAFGELTDETPLHTNSQNLSSTTNQILQASRQYHKPTLGVKGSRKQYLFKLDSPITPTVLSSAAILSSQPVIITGEGEEGAAQFCQVNDLDVHKIKSWLATNFPSFRAIFAPINKAYKDLSPFSPYPTLGVDATLPHYRPQRIKDSVFLPAQDHYPVWYFFYGTLANPELLADLFGAPDIVPVLIRANISGGKLRTWGKKYRALVNSPGSQVDGWAYEVLSRDQEDALLAYETAKYEVVRVSIAFNESAYRGQVVQGCTFRFAGEENELDEL